MNLQLTEQSLHEVVQFAGLWRRQFRRDAADEQSNPLTQLRQFNFITVEVFLTIGGTQGGTERDEPVIHFNKRF
ncbi:hypothetical protein [Hyphomicrobium sp. ghe19]|uniref:hypothetical protein n=1 Tax=Hyphomicrobium sp. ghe19 TaxID=2682968 RepID=UPI0030D5A668